MAKKPSSANATKAKRSFWEQNHKILLGFALSLTALSGFFFFDPNVSTGGDDAQYIQRGYNFIFEGRWPTFQGPLYPVFLSVFIYLFGINLFVLKLLSLLSTLGFLYFFYRTFQHILPGFMLAGLMFLFAINASLLYYASQTYNEAFFLFLQMLFIFLFKKYAIDAEQSQWKELLIISVLLFFLFLVKSVAIAALPAVLLYFILRKRFKTAGIVLVFYVLLFTGYQGIKQLAFESKGLQMGSQGSTLLLKNPYKPDEGREDLSGFFTRFWVNSNQYISQQFYKFMGLRPDVYVMENKPFLTFITYLLFFAGFFYFYRYQPLQLFTGLYLAFLLGATFLALQTVWNQERLIVPFAPLVATFLLHTIYEYLNKYRLGNARVIMMVFTAILLLAGSVKFVSKIPDKLDQLTAFINGNRLERFTPDWQNYISMCQYAAENLPAEAYTAVRKPGIAFIYTNGHKFFGIYRVETSDPDELYTKLKNAGVTHVIVASLRLVPDQNTGRVITTIRKYLGLIQQAYPERVRLIHQIGEDEPAYLFELK